MGEKHDDDRLPQREDERLSPPPRAIDLRELGIDEEQAADLRFRLSAFAEDWDRPEMDVYDVD